MGKQIATLHIDENGELMERKIGSNIEEFLKEFEELKKKYNLELMPAVRNIDLVFTIKPKPEHEDKNS